MLPLRLEIDDHVTLFLDFLDFFCARRVFSAVKQKYSLASVFFFVVSSRGTGESPLCPSITIQSKERAPENHYHHHIPSSKWPCTHTERSCISSPFRRRSKKLCRISVSSIDSPFTTNALIVLSFRKVRLVSRIALLSAVGDDRFASETLS